MSKADLKFRVKKLHEQVDDLRYRYHVLNDPEVTDQMYDGLMDELRKIESVHPEFKTPDSPTQRVAGKPLEKFEKIKHAVPQWSFNDAFNREDLDNWENKIVRMLEKDLGHKPKDLDYICELKIDGLHVVLTYEGGKLVTAATRGDGKVGENVTQNVRTIHSVPLKLKKPVDLICEGEVWLGRKMFAKINKQREKIGEPLFANPRNMAAGTIRQLDAKVVEKRNLSVIVYDISSENVPATQAEELKELGSLGFFADSNWKVCKNLDEVIKFYEALNKKKNSFEFWIDGVVIKVNQKKYQDALGFTGKAPRWAIALKFPAEQGTTKIKEIYVQVGRTGALTPVAFMDPVQLAGTTVTHATLHNFDEIKRLGVKVGDTVVVEKAGDIIPKVVRVLEKMRTGDEKVVREPKICPICGEAVERRQILGKKFDSVAFYCSNKKCYAKELKNIIHFVSKKAFNIDGLGKKIVAQLVDEGIIKNVADIFTLTKGDLEPLERFAEKSAENLVTSIHQAKEVTLPRFIFGLGIDHVGEETAIALAKHFTLLKKIMTATAEELTLVPDVGSRVAQSIAEYFGDQKNIELVETLQDNGVNIKDIRLKIEDLRLLGQSFVFTGGLEFITRDEAKDKVRELGGDISSSVSKKTGYVVVGKDPGSKYEKAKKLGVKILTEGEFVKLIK